jgi:glutamyl-tRNA synthetase
MELEVLEMPKSFNPKLPLHPEKPERGFREYTITPETKDNSASFWVSKKDAEALEPGTVVRLMELFNVKIESKKEKSVTTVFSSESYEDVRKIKGQLIQWIPKGEEFQGQVVMPDASVTEGFAESACKKLKPDAIIQFERFGFARINEVNQKLIAYYAHK